LFFIFLFVFFRSSSSAFFFLLLIIITIFFFSYAVLTLRHIHPTIPISRRCMLQAFLTQELEAGAAPLRVKKTRDATGKTAMHFAAAAGQAETCAYLYELVREGMGASPAKELANAVDADGSTPLSLCVAAAPRETVRATTQTLLEFGADPRLANNRGVAPIHRAAGEGHCDVIDLLLDHASASSSSSSSSSSSDDRILNLMSDETGSPLHWAAGEKRVEAVRLLSVDRGAALDVPNSAGLAPILLAAAVGCGDAVAVLAEAGAKLTVELPGGINLLHMCAEMPDAAQAATGVRAVLSTMQAAQKAAACGQIYAAQGVRKGLYPVELAARTGHRIAVELLREASAPAVLEAVVNSSGSNSSSSSSNPSGNSDTSVDALLAAAALAKAAEDEAQAKEAAQQGAAAPSLSSSSAPMNVLLPQLTRKAESAEDAAAAEACKDEGNDHYRAGRVEEAIASYSKGLEKDGTNHVLWGNRCACYLRCKNYDAAVFDASAALHVKSDWLKARVRLGKAFMGLHRYEDAAVALWEVCKKEKDPDTKDMVEALFQKAIRLGRKEHKAKTAGR
jgi:ankyrin repeat protein